MDNPASESSNAPLDMSTAADAFSSLMGADDPSENEPQDDDNPEAAAERLAKQELAGEEVVPEDGDPEPAPDDVTVEIDGKAVKLTKAQIAENYKNGLRQADYTQKTMQTAEVRKAADAERQQARQERADYAQKLHNYAAQMDGGIAEQSALLTQELLDSDPVQYLSIERTVKQRQANLAQAQQELHRVNQIHQQEQQQAHQTFLQDQQRIITDTLPELKDPAKMRTAIASLEPFLEARGFTKNDASVVLDARVFLMAHKAMQYDALIERAGKAVKKVAALPAKVERSGSAETSRPDQRGEAIKRLGKSGSIDDAASAFAQFKF